MLRVLWKICKEEAYVKLGNWLVFDASSGEILRLCRLVLSLLSALPDAPQRDPKSLQKHGNQSKTRKSIHEIVSNAAKSADRAHKASTFGFLILEEKLSVRHWSLANGSQIRQLIEDAVAYQQHTACSIIKKFW